MKTILRLALRGRFLFMVFLAPLVMSIPLSAQWVQTNGPYSGSVYSLLSFAVSGTNLFAGTDGGGGVFLSTNNGTSWTTVNTGLTNTAVQSLAVSGTNLFAGTYGGGVFLSTNNGTTWTAVNIGLTNTLVLSLAVSGTNLFAGTNGGVFLSTNNGISWTANGLTNTSVRSLAVSGANLFAGTWGGGVFLSTNNGTTWTAVNSGLTYTDVPSLVVSGTNLFAGPNGGGVFLSTNNGTSWTAVNSGLTDTWVRSLAVSGMNLFAGTSSGGVWRRPLSEIVTSVQILPNELPTHFNLDQNYPNPFNPATTISFGLPSKSFVSLKVFDALGREIATVVSEELFAGNYSKNWNAYGMPSGVYFYRMQSGSFAETKKLVLLR